MQFYNRGHIYVKGGQFFKIYFQWPVHDCSFCSIEWWFAKKNLSSIEQQQLHFEDSVIVTEDVAPFFYIPLTELMFLNHGRQKEPLFFSFEWDCAVEQAYFALP